MADAFFSSSWRILEPHGCATVIGSGQPVDDWVIEYVVKRLARKDVVPCRSCRRRFNGHLFSLTNGCVPSGHVVCHPGDAIFGDGDGVVVVARDELAAIAAATEKQDATEEALRANIRQAFSQ